ncbi:class I adenylate-forming enzyme family protein [Nocardia sp. NPDC050710]|uniref:class I adenylate-forming enzyme family protein n=1 Tax=Nocardia sp. NPDC050710 TaxID=3157220 RepID=UPI0033E319D9
MLDWHAERAAQTVFHLDRPFDIAPEAGIVVDGPAAARIVHDAASSWYAAGVRPGDRVAICKDNHYDILLLAAAAARIGAIPALISASARPEVLRHLLNKVEPTVAMVSAKVLSALQGSADRCDAAGRFVVTGDGEVSDADNVLRLDELRGGAPAPVRPRGEDEPAIICHTSGTTGLPKLVVHSTRTLYEANRLDSMPAPIVSSRRGDIFGSAISFVHARATGTFTAQLSHAPAKLVIISNHDLENVTRVLSEHTLTILEACPNIFLHWQPLTRTDPALFERIRLYFNTFDLIHPATVRAFLDASRRRFPLWLQGWGQSETGPLTAGIYPRIRVRRSASAAAVTSDIGWAVPGFSRIRVVDATLGKHRWLGKPGLLMSSSRGCCVDYLGETDRYDEKVDGKWWNTGDVGYRDWLGRIRLLDREVDIIPSMSGIDVESTLLDRIENATEVVVLGAPGRLPVPIVCLASGSLDDAQWAKAVEGLPPLAEPLVLPWQDIPRTSTWKVRRLELREQVLGTSRTFGTGRWT